MRLVPLTLALLASLAGCAPVMRVTLLPQASGLPNAVEVKTARATHSVATPYQVAKEDWRGDMAIEQTTEQDVRQRHADLLAVQPAGDERFTLYFAVGGSTLTPESETTLHSITGQALARPGGEIIVIGHTDRVGTVSSNDKLSLERARAIRELLIQRGFSPLRIHAIGRGEREPALQTADEVDEPNNRRVQIIVR